MSMSPSISRYETGNVSEPLRAYAMLRKSGQTTIIKQRSTVYDSGRANGLATKTQGDPLSMASQSTITPYKITPTRLHLTTPTKPC